MIVYTRNKNYKSLKGVIKQSSSGCVLGIVVDIYRKWIEIQFTPEMNWVNVEIDHVKPICKFDISEVGELEEAFCWKNTQPFSEENQHKGTKYVF